MLSNIIKSIVKCPSNEPSDRLWTEIGLSKHHSSTYIVLSEIPDIIRNYVNDNIPYPVGLIGCRSIKPEISLDCCEYDLAIFNKHTSSSRTLKIGKYNVELISLPALPNLKDPLILKDMTLLHDDSNFILSSAINGSNPKDYQRMLTAFGRRAMINCFFIAKKLIILLKHNHFYRHCG
jgi:hypothetical protein